MDFHVGQTVYVLVGKDFEKAHVCKGTIVNSTRVRFSVSYDRGLEDFTHTQPIWFNKETMWNEKKTSRCFFSKDEAVAYSMQSSPVPLHCFKKNGRLRFIPI